MIATTFTSAFLILTSALAPSTHAVPQEKARATETWTQERLEAVANEVKADIENMRGEKFKQPVAVKMATREGFTQYAHDREMRSTTKEQTESDEMIAKLLGMIPPGMNLLETELNFLGDQVGGFYDPTTKSFCLMEGFPLGVAKIILAHELDHALDDQLFDIDGKMKAREDNSDALLAYRAVVEGTGTNVMTQWLFKHMKEIDLSGLQAFQDMSSKSMAGAPLWLSMPTIASYLCGSAFLVHSDSMMKGQAKAATNDDIRHAFTDVPRSMEQVLHPEKYWDEKQRDEPRKVAFDLAKLPEGWKVLRQDTLGEFALALLATPEADRQGLDFSNAASILGLKFTNEIGHGWGGDRCILLAKDEARVLVLATCWDTPRDAAEFYGVMRVLQPQLERSLKALLAEGKFGKHSTTGASIDYGGASDEVQIRLQCGVSKPDMEKLEKALTYHCDAAKTR